MNPQFSIVLVTLHLFLPESSCQTGSSKNDALEFASPIYTGSIIESFPFTNDSINEVVQIEPPINLIRGNATVQYSILSGNDDGVFSIDPITGTLRATQQIDRENLPFSASTGRFTLTVQASAVDWEPAQARVIINVIDVNDNEPKFNPETYAISIVENLPPGFNVVRVTAFDSDSEDNGRFEYRLTDPSGAFKIDRLTGWLSVADSTPLDREKTTSLNLLVEAVEERPVSSNTPSARIDIDLTDANDNSPVFQPSNLYSFRADASAEAGSIVGQVLAIDADANENGRVTYAIQHHEEGGRWNNFTTSSNEVPFSIHPKTGHLIVVDTPLVKDSYQLIIEASDEPANPSERRTSLAIVKITAESQSAKAPAFVNIPYEFRIDASAPADKIVGQVKAVGTDVRYALKQNPSKPVPLTLDPRSGALRVTGPLTSLAGTTHLLNVTATDGRSEKVTVPLVVNVVADSIARPLNVARSKEKSLVYKFNVTENVAGATAGRIAYPGEANYDYMPLDPAASGWQMLKLERNGTLLTRKALDREQAPNVTALVAVRDKDLVDTVHVIVTVLDVNDNAPIFNESRYAGRVKENAPAGTAVRLERRIESTDADDWPNNKTRYSLSGNGSRHFRIDPVTAEVTVARSRAIDRERFAVYNLAVVATDEKFSSTAELTIVVEDINDNPPEIVSFFPALGVVALERSAERNQDFGDHIVICADGSCSLPIGLDEPDAKLPLGRSASTFNKIRNQLLHVVDEWVAGAENATSFDEEQVLDKAFQEVLHNATILIQVPEDFPVNGSIGSFRTGDRDSVPSSGVRFALRPDSEEDLPFAIRPRNGTLALKRNLIADRTYSFFVKVTDSEGLTSETSVALQAVDVNNHRPIFDKPFYELHLDEGVYHLKPLSTIEATDQDWGENARLTYSLSNRTTHPFEIDEESGRLFVDGLIDREQVEFYRFTVHATDHGWPPLKNHVEVVVYIEDINDNAPRFELPTDESDSVNSQPYFNASIADGTPPGVPIIRIKATDEDVDTRTNGNVTYQLASHHQLFGIDPSTGSLFTKSTIEYDKLGSEMNVVVVAADRGTPSFSTVGVVHVNVVKGCRGGLMPRRQQTISLDEDAPFPLLLVNLTQTDEESGVQLLLARIEPVTSVTQSLFTVEQTEPVLWLTGALDYERERKYIVYMKVQRPDNRTATSCWDTANEELVVYIFVNDVNDNAPVFRERDPAVATVSSDAPIGSVVVRLTATDADDEENGAIQYSITYVTLDEADEDNGSAFGIDSKTGALSVLTSLEQYAGRVLIYQVEATDRNGAGLTSYLRVSVHVLGKANQVALVLATRIEDIANYSANISRTVSDISGMDVWVRSVEPHVEGDAINSALSEVVLYARNQSGERLISSEELNRVLNAKRSDLNQKLQRYQLKAIRNLDRGKKSREAVSSAQMEVLEVTLIALAVAVLLGALVAVVFIALVRARLKRKQAGLLPRSALAIGMDYHLQALHNVPFRRGDVFVESSSSEVYAEVSSEKGDADLIVSPPVKERRIEVPMCSSCRRIEKMHCRCNCGKKLRRSNTQRRTKAAPEKTLKRHHSFTAYSCGHRHQHRSKADAVNKQVRLHVPHRPVSLVVDSHENIVRELERSVAEEEHQHHKKQRSRRSSSGVSTLDVRRQLFQPSDAPEHRYSSSSGRFEDSLNPDRHRSHSKR